LVVKTENGYKRAFTKELWFEIDLDGLLRGDPKTQAETWKIMREGGALTTNEWRENMGMNPVTGEEGDYLIVPGGFTRLDQIDNQGDRMDNVSETPDESDEPDDEPDNGPDNDSSAAITATIDSAFEVFQRIHNNTLNQVQRWKETSPDEMLQKAQDFASKQTDRLEEAFSPIEHIASHAGVQFNAKQAAQDYGALLKSLEYSDWFQLESLEGTFHNYLESEIQ